MREDDDDAAERMAAFTAREDAVSVDEVLDLYDDLPAVEAGEMIGDWDGDVILTGHPGERHLGRLRWVGKTFRGPDDVDPMMCTDESGARVASDVMGEATLRNVEYRGVVTATMVYDRHPTFDHFRRVGPDVVIGMMDSKGDPAPLAFVLRRRA